MNKRGREYQDFRSKVFRLTVKKNFVGDPFSVSLVSGTKKVLIKGGVSKLSVEIFLSHSAEKTRMGTFWCFTNSMHKKGLSLNSFDNTLSHCAYKIRTRTLLCFERILVSKVFKQRKGELHVFVDFFYFAGPKIFSWEPFCVSESFRLEKLLWIRGTAGLTVFRRKAFVSQYRNEKF